jgi:hypothetical protein
MKQAEKLLGRISEETTLCPANYAFCVLLCRIPCLMLAARTNRGLCVSLASSLHLLSEPPPSPQPPLHTRPTRQTPGPAKLRAQGPTAAGTVVLWLAAAVVGTGCALMLALKAKLLSQAVLQQQSALVGASCGCSGEGGR